MSFEQRLRSRLVYNSATGCREWTGTRSPKGYGQIGRDGRVVYTHRAVWELAYGPIPPGKHVCHHCDNPPCGTEEHLYLGTNRENHADKIRKGRQARGEGVGNSKLTEADVLAIRASTENRHVLAARYGVTIWAIHDVRRRSWRHLR